jgi:predicted GH43/DUF377 family glycosyl hydrolase
MHLNSQVAGITRTPEETPYVEEARITSTREDDHLNYTAEREPQANGRGTSRPSVLETQWPDLKTDRRAESETARQTDRVRDSQRRGS